MHGDPFDGGIASVILARGALPYRLTVAFFLIDVYCLGIKDVFLKGPGVEDFVSGAPAMAETAPLTTVEPAYARKLLRDAAAWAASICFKPHRDFIAVEQIFGNVDSDTCETAFRFGQGGKPFYVSGATETRAQIRQRRAHLTARFGEHGFDYVIPI